MVEDATYKKLIDFAKDAGYDITIDEIKEYCKGMTASKEGELQDSELNKVAGGSFLVGPGFPLPVVPGLSIPQSPGRFFSQDVVEFLSQKVRY